MLESISRVHRSRPGFSRLELVIVLLIVGVLIVLLLPAVQQDRGSRRNPCKNNLKQIGLALHNYHDVHGSFPPAIVYGPDGMPWHSWRTLLLPFLERPDLYERYRFDEPWNGPNNNRLAAEAGSLPCFHCYADEQAAAGATSYVAVVGEGTMWPPDGATTIDDATDGADKTLLVVELSDSGVNWMEPRDLRLDRMTFEIGASKGVGLRSRHGGTNRWFREDDPVVVNAVLVDGSLRTLGGPGTPPDAVRSLLLRDDGE